MFEDALSWEDAEKRCTYDGGHLATITSAVENAFVSSLPGMAGQAWIGCSDSEKEGSWAWTKPGPGDTTLRRYNWQFANWKSGYGEEGGEDCVSVNHAGWWRDRACSDYLKFVCEIEDPVVVENSPTFR